MTAPDLLEAAKAMAAWAWDPDADHLEQFERVAEEFHAATGYLRPGKSDAYPRSQEYMSEQAKAWDEWRMERTRKVLAALRAAIKAEEERRAAEHARLVRFAHCVGCDGYEDPMMCDGCAARGGTGEGKPEEARKPWFCSSSGKVCAPGDRCAVHHCDDTEDGCDCC